MGLVTYVFRVCAAFMLMVVPEAWSASPLQRKTTIGATSLGLGRLVVCGSLGLLRSGCVLRRVGWVG